MSVTNPLRALAVGIALTSFLLPVRLLAIPAFKGAEGFGAQTRHARGTIVCIVNNLDDADKAQRMKFMVPGSFRYCLAKAQEFGGGYVVFDVSGTIKLKRQAFVPSNTYIAGHTSSGGIAIEGNAIVIKDANDIVIRHIRHREARRKDDAFRVYNSHDVVIDHVSVSFFKDGAVDIVTNSSDVTVQWSHMGDAMDSGSKKERYHGQPNLLSANVNRVSLHHNFYTHGHTRMPLVPHAVAKSGFLIDFSNNVIYNYGKYPSRFAAIEGRGNVIGNYYIPGRNTHADGSASAAGAKGSNTLLHKDLTGGARPPILVENGMRLYLENNLMDDGFGHDASNFTDKYGKQVELGVPGPVTSVRKTDDLAEARMVASGPGKIVEEIIPFQPLSRSVAEIPPVTILPARENMKIVLQTFGALPRDNTDRRLVKELKTRGGRWKYMKPHDNNVYTHRNVKDSDGDGLPDDFEDRAGGNIDPIGRDLYLELDNIEIYLDELAEKLLDSLT